MVGKGCYVYIVSNKGRNVLYTGVMSNLHNRIWEHRNNFGSTFTTRYRCTDLIYWEFFDSIEEAIQREKRIKKWNRAWKDDLIKSFNPTLRDLFDEMQ